MKISCIIPAQDEEGNIKEAVLGAVRTLEYFKKMNDYEIIIVDDNSTDRTGSIVDILSKKNNKIKVIHRSKNPGFGNAIKSGLKHATGEIIIFFMGDLSDNPDDIPKLVRKIQDGYDVAYGSRFVRGGKAENYPLFKIICNRGYNNILRLLFGIPHKDITNAFKVYRKEVLLEIGIENIKSENFEITVEIPLKAYILGFKSAEIPVTWNARQRGASKLKISKNAPFYFKRLVDMLVFRKRYNDTRNI